MNPKLTITGWGITLLGVYFVSKTKTGYVVIYYMLLLILLFLLLTSSKTLDRIMYKN